MNRFLAYFCGFHWEFGTCENVEGNLPLTPPHGHTQYIRNQCNFLSKLVIVALSHQEWKSMPLAKGTCCSVEQWNDSGEWVALGPALKGPVNRTGFERYNTSSGIPSQRGFKSEPRWRVSSHALLFALFLIDTDFLSFFNSYCSVCECLQPSLVLTQCLISISCPPAPNTDGYNFHEVMYPVGSLWDVSYFSDCLLSQTDSLFGRRSPPPSLFPFFSALGLAYQTYQKQKNQHPPDKNTQARRVTCSPWKWLLVFVDVLPCAPKGPSFRSGSPVDRDFPFCCLCSTNKPQLAGNKHTVLCCTHALILLNRLMSTWEVCFFSFLKRTIVKIGSHHFIFYFLQPGLNEVQMICRPHRRIYS